MNKGFTLLGALLAIFFISVGLAALLSLVVTSLGRAATSEMRLIASGLAQEGIEMVRDERRSSPDGEWGNWEWYSTKSIDVPEDYRAQYDLGLIGYADTYLRLNEVSGLYQYDSGNDSPFKRKVTLTRLGEDEVRVIVEVSWNFRTKDYQLVVEDRLWKWLHE